MVEAQFCQGMPLGANVEKKHEGGIVGFREQAFKRGYCTLGRVNQI
jgi:hypothetical protein